MMLYSNLPQIDLHGYDRDYARIVINDFINDNYQMKNLKVLIIHGVGTGILRKTTHETLRKNKLVSSFKLDNFNSGTTIVEIRKRNWQKDPFMVVYKTLCEEREFEQTCIQKIMKTEDFHLGISY